MSASAQSARADDFREFLAGLRQFNVAHVNPEYADELRDDLTKYINIVVKWINSAFYYDRKAMADAIEFFSREFHNRYRGTGKVYRGTLDLSFDGKPASYTRKLKVAQAFGESKGGAFYVIERKAPADSLDFGKLLKQYATCDISYCDEAEIVLFNTRVPEKQITEYTV